MDESDALLMRRACSGDRAAFGTLVGRYQGSLRRVAIARLGCVDGVDDIVQETFLAAYKSRHTYDEQFAFRTWLWTILVNQCRRHVGRHARTTQSLPSAERCGATNQACCDEPSAQDATSPADASPGLERLLAQERNERLAALLARLSAVQAEALRLRFFAGLKFPEIAEQMQCSLGAAKNRVRWGLLKLSEWIAAETAGDVAAQQNRDQAASLLPARFEHDPSANSGKIDSSGIQP